MATDSRRPRPPVALTIAASDSGGGAGIQADLATFAAHGVYGVSVLTAGTAQNTRGISAVEPFSPQFIRRQMDAVFPDFRPSGVKIGALHDARRLRAVAAGLRLHAPANVVLDPVLAAKDRSPLFDPAAIPLLRRTLLPLCDLVTPNLPEAEALAGIPIRNQSDRRLAAGILADAGPRAVLIKGGHRRGAVVRDLLFDGRRFIDFEHPRSTSRARHGTGCTLSAAIAANLALGKGLESSVREAIDYVERAIEAGVFPGRGWGVPDRFASVPAGRLTPSTGRRTRARRTPSRKRR
ncbi:MAG: bifunctional hydroxymethylpyrimidine kinase/phosphomethylpyrimidine kinase [Thermoanaerobaculia bacterium]